MLERFELPLLKAGFWPESLLDPRVIAALPSQFERRLEHAFAHHVWPLLRTGGRPSSFSAKDPLRLLAHNLDFWVPYIDAAVPSESRGMDAFRSTTTTPSSPRE